MAQSSKYEKANARAREHGYSSAYAERKARSLARGFSSPRTERNASEAKRNVKRDYGLERERADIRANAEGFRNARDRAAFRKLSGVDKETWQKKRTLDFFGISENQFNRIRTANKKWSKEYPMLQWTAINTYDIYTDKDIHNWSERRVGYILAFHAAIVNPKTNWDSLSRKGRRILTDKGLPLTNKSQFYYLVKYTNLMSVNQFEARYGQTIVLEAMSGKVKP